MEDTGRITDIGGHS